jgi:diguanylate cyclase (GGDEF)-like protein
MRVLLVEDSLGDADLVREYLADEGEIVHSGSLAQALDLMKTSHYDVSLVDLGLPDAGGFTAVEKLRLASPTTPLVVVTGSDDRERAIGAMRAGAQDYLVKGRIRPDELLRSLQFAIERKRYVDLAVEALVHNPDAVLVLDRRGFVQFANPAAERLFGVPLAQIVGENLGFPIGAGGCFEIETFARGALGQPLVAEMLVEPVQWNGMECFIAAVHDVSGRKEALERAEARTADLRSANAKLEEMCMTDDLTLALNRRGAERALLEEGERARRRGGSLAAIVLDIDDFKSVNDSLGHDAGDEVLRSIAAVIRQKIRPTDRVARLGGDEFLLMLPGSSERNATLVAERIRQAIEGKTQVPGRGRAVTASLAVLQLQAEACSLEEILARVHPLLRSGKLGGKNRVALPSFEADKPPHSNGITRGPSSL